MTTARPRLSKPLLLIAHYLVNNPDGYKNSPEVARHTGVSLPVVHNNMYRLVRLGWMQHDRPGTRFDSDEPGRSVYFHLTLGGLIALGDLVDNAAADPRYAHLNLKDTS